MLVASQRYMRCLLPTKGGCGVCFCCGTISQKHKIRKKNCPCASEPSCLKNLWFARVRRFLARQFTRAAAVFQYCSCLAISGCGRPLPFVNPSSTQQAVAVRRRFLSQVLPSETQIFASGAGKHFSMPTGPRPLQDLLFPSPFRLVKCPAPPVDTRTPTRTALHVLREEDCLPFSYSEHSHPIAAVESPVDKIRHRGTTPEATSVARLVMNFDHRVTLVGVIGTPMFRWV